MLLAFLLFPHLRSCVGVELEPGRFAVAAGAAARLAALFPGHLAVVEHTDDRIVIETIDSDGAGAAAALSSGNASAAEGWRPTLAMMAATDSKTSTSAATAASTPPAALPAQWRGNGQATMASSPSPVSTVSGSAAASRHDDHHDDVVIELQLPASSASTPAATGTETASSATLPLTPTASACDSRSASAAAGTVTPAHAVLHAASAPSTAHEPPAPTPRSVCAATGVLPPALTADEKARCAPSCATVGAHAFSLQAVEVGSASTSGPAPLTSSATFSSAAGQRDCYSLSVKPAARRRLVLLRGDMWAAAQAELLAAGAKAADTATAETISVGAASVAPSTSTASGAESQPISIGASASGHTDAVASSPLAVLLHTELPDSVRFQTTSPLYTLITSLPTGSRFATYHDIAADWRHGLFQAERGRAGSSDGSGAAAVPVSAAAIAPPPPPPGATRTRSPLPCFAQLPQNVATADVVYTSWAPRGGWHLFCWERL